MADRSQRAKFRHELAKKLAARLEGSGVGVDEFFPGDRLQAEHVWCNGITGVGDPDDQFLMAGRKHRWDVFQVVWMVQTALGGRDILEQSEHCDDIAEELVSIIVEDSGGENFDADVCELFIAREDGPNVLMLDQGPAAIREIAIQARSHLT